MAFADLGVRIILEDGAKAGFDALGMSIFNLFSRTSLLTASWSKLPQSIKTAGMVAGVSGLLFGGLADVLWQAIDAAAQLEQELANLSVSVNGANDAGTAMRDTLISIADHSIYTTATIADGFTTLGVDGWNAKDLIDGMGAAMVRFAEASRTDVVPAANLLGTVMETYGAKASEATQYTNDLTFALYNGQKTVANMQSAFNQAGATAYGLKIPFGELSDTLALLGEDGLKGEKAGSALRYMLTSLSDPTDKAAKALAALGIITVNSTTPALEKLRSQLDASGGAARKASDNYDGTLGSLKKMFEAAQKVGLLHTDQSFMQWATASGILKDKLFDASGNFIGIKGTIEQLGQAIDKMNPQQKAQALQQIFNVRGAQAAKLLLQDYKVTIDKFGNLDIIRKSTDAQKKAADVTDTLAGNTKRLGSTWHDALAQLGNVDLGPLGGLFSGLSNLLDKFNMAPKPVRDFVGQLLVFATAVAGIIFVVSTIVFIIGAFGTELATIIPIVLAVIGVVAGIAFIFTLVKTHINEIMTFLHPLIALLGNGLAAAGKVVLPLLKDIGGYLGDVLSTNLKMMGQVLQGVLIPAWHNLQDSFKNLAPLLGPAVSALKAIAVVIGSVLAVVIGFTVGTLTGLIAGIMTFIGGVVTFVSGIVTVISGFFQIFVGLWQIVAGVVMAIVTGHFDKIGAIILGGLKTIWNGVKSIFGGLLTMILGLFQAVFGTIIAFVGGFIKGIISFFQHLFDTLVGHSIIPDLVNAISKLIAMMRDTVLAIIRAVVNGAIALFTLLKAGIELIVHAVVAIVHTIVTGLLVVVNAISTKIIMPMIALFHMVLAAVIYVVTLVVTHFHEMWNNVMTAFNNARNFVTGKINDIKNAILTPIQNLGQQLFDSAKNAIQMFINGLDSMISKVKGKVGDIANSVKSVLGFHSPPNEGPLSDSDQYMPNMMRMYAKGIDDHKGLVGNSAAGVAAHIGKTLGNITPTTGINATGTVMTHAMMSSIQSGMQANAGQRDITIPLVVDGQTLSKVVLKQVGHDLILNGVGRQLR